MTDVENKQTKKIKNFILDKLEWINFVLDEKLNLEADEDLNIVNQFPLLTNESEVEWEDNEITPKPRTLSLPEVIHFKNLSLDDVPAIIENSEGMLVHSLSPTDIDLATPLDPFNVNPLTPSILR